MSSTKILFGLIIAGILLTASANAQWCDPLNSFQQNFNVTNLNTTEDIPSGYTVNVSFNMSDIVSRGLTDVNGTNMRFWWYNSTSGSCNQLARTNVTAKNAADTTFIFRTEQSINPNGGDTGYSVYYGNSDVKNNLENWEDIYNSGDGTFVTRRGWDYLLQNELHFVDDRLNFTTTKQNADNFFVSSNKENFTNFHITGVFNITYVDPANPDEGIFLAGFSDQNTTIDKDAKMAIGFAYYGGQSVLIRENLGGSLSNTANMPLIYGHVYNFTFSKLGKNVTLRIYNDSFVNTTYIETNITLPFSYTILTSAWETGGSSSSHRVDGWLDTVKIRQFMTPEPNVTLLNESSFDIDDCTALTVPTLNLTLYNEDNSTQILRGTLEALFRLENPSGFSSNYSVTIENQTNFTFCLDTDSTAIANATFKYYAPGYSDRYYYMINHTFTSNLLSIPLYLLNNTASESIKFIVNNNYNSPISDMVIRVSRFFIGDGTYRLVAMGLSDFDGEFPINLKLFEDYSIEIEQHSQSVRIFPDKHISTTDDITLVTQEGTIVDYYQYFADIIGICVSDQLAQTLNCTYNDIPELTQVQLVVEKKQLVGGFIEVCSNTTDSTSEFIVCSVAGYNDTNLVFYLNGRFIGADETFATMASGDLLFDTANPYGTIGIIIMLFLLITGIMFGYWNPIIPVVMGIFILIVGMMLEIVLISSTAMMGLVIAGGILIYKMRS